MWGSGEMADAHALGACALTGVWVRLPPSPPFHVQGRGFNLLGLEPVAVRRGPRFQHLMVNVKKRKSSKKFPTRANRSPKP